MVTVRVPLPAGRDASYDVVIEAGALGRLPALLSGACPAARYAVIADALVAPLHGEPLVSRLAAADLPAALFTFPAGEGSKSRAAWAALTDALLAARFGRDAAVVAVGGGVTGDLAGFVAATFLRGIPWASVPTSCVAMVDAGVGGKTGIDAPLGKNLIGAFHQPRLVVADPDVLRTLPATAFGDGLAEAVKHGVIADADYFEFLQAHATEVMARDGRALERMIARSVEIKAAIVAADPLEAGRRAILNFGHTVAHAIEAVSEFHTTHGAAVAMGMVAEARLGERLGHTAAGTAQRLSDALRRFGLKAAAAPDLEPDALLDAMRADKKMRDGALRFALPARVGVMFGAEQSWTVAVPEQLVRQTLVEWRDETGA